MSGHQDDEQNDRLLRAAAEQRLGQPAAEDGVTRPAEELLYELRVHQVELEMQNEALRQSQDALAQARDRYIDLYEFAPLGYVTLCASGEIDQINLTGANLLRKERSKLLQKSFGSLVAPPDRDRWLRYLIDLKQDDEHGPMELQLLRGDGTTFHAQLDAMVQKTGAEGIHLRMALSDITERKQAEDAARESEATHRSILQTAMDGFWIVDAQGRLQEVNDAYCRMSGYAEQELLAMRIGDLEAMDTPDETAVHLERVMARGESRFQTRHRRKNGSVFDVEVSVQYQNSPPGRWVVFLQDLTERNRIEAARAALEAQLRESQKMQTLGTLAGGIAHDFNNILATIMGNVEIARQDVGPAHPALESLTEIGKAGQRAKHLVDQILSFGRRRPMERKAIKLAPVLDEAAKLLRATQPAGVHLQVTCAPDLPLVLADAIQIEQIVLNLCNNAWQAIEGQGRPGRVDVSLENHQHLSHDDARPATVFASSPLQPGPFVCLSVRDNGSGMDEATLGHLFEPFFTTKPVGQGTGLGLAVVHGIAQAHQAVIEVQSTVGEGSCFRLFFPVADTATPQEQPRAASPSPMSVPLPPALGKHVLYLDDDDSIVYLMKRLLERKGFRLSGFNKQADALAALRADPSQFDLAMTDYNMPGMSGLEVVRAMRLISPDLPIVMVSGHISEELRAQAPGAGVNELIFKSDTVAELCEVVERLVSAHRVVR